MRFIYNRNESDRNKRTVRERTVAATIDVESMGAKSRLDGGIIVGCFVLWPEEEEGQEGPTVNCPFHRAHNLLSSPNRQASNYLSLSLLPIAPAPIATKNRVDVDCIFTSIKRAAGFDIFCCRVPVQTHPSPKNVPPGGVN